jgi:O-antigen/teichoic acid export membrane protein
MLSMAWSAASFGGGQLLAFGSMLVLARLIEPKAFGTVALATTFLAVLTYAQESGLWAAIIYSRDDDLEVAAASALAFTPLVGLALYGLCFGLAPVAADVFHTPELTSVLRVTALLLIPRSLGIVPLALLERELEYRSIAKAELSAASTQTAACIALAVAGFGVWSLVFGYLAASVVQTAAFWLLVPWRPRLRDARPGVLRQMFRYGRFVGIANILNLTNRTIDNMTVARVLGPAPLAFYSVAFRLASMPVQVIGTIVGRGMFAAYAALQDDVGRMRDAYLQNVQRLALLALPVSVALAILAHPLVEVLLGPAWLDAVVPLQILAVFGVVRAFGSTTGEIWLALGKPHLRMVWEIWHAVLVVPLLIVGTLRFGLPGTAGAMLVVDLMTGVPAIVITLRLLHLKPFTAGRALVPPVACTGLLAATLATLLPLTDGLAPWLSLSILVVAGSVAYLAGSFLLARSVLDPMWISLRAARPASR